MFVSSWECVLPSYKLNSNENLCTSERCPCLPLCPSPPRHLSLRPWPFPGSTAAGVLLSAHFGYLPETGSQTTKYGATKPNASARKLNRDHGNQRTGEAVSRNLHLSVSVSVWVQQELNGARFIWKFSLRQFWSEALQHLGDLLHRHCKRLNSLSHTQNMTSGLSEGFHSRKRGTSEGAQLPCEGRPSHFGSTPLLQWSPTSGGFHRCSAAGPRPSAASPPTYTQQASEAASQTPTHMCDMSGEVQMFSTLGVLTGIFNRKSSWLKRKPRSVLEDGLGVVLNKPVGRSTKIRCRLPGNEV